LVGRNRERLMRIRSSLPPPPHHFLPLTPSPSLNPFRRSVGRS
jgi:hypothetical protein